MNLKQDILSWDGKCSNDIKKIYQRQNISSESIPEVINVMQDPQLQVGASWLLKHYCEQNGDIPVKLAESLYNDLASFTDWQTRLHLLQIIPYLPMTDKIKRPLETFLRSQLSDTNKFIRAWTYNGFHLLANRFPEFKSEVLHFLELAMKDEAPSVKARIRRILNA